jgi:hypothetical protein
MKSSIARACLVIPLLLAAGCSLSTSEDDEAETAQDASELVGNVMSVPTVVYKLGGHAEAFGRLTSFTRSHGPAWPDRETVVDLTLKGSRYPKVLGPVEVYEVATNRRVGSGRASIVSEYENRSSYYLRLPNLVLSPEKDYVLVVGTVLGAVGGPKVRTKPFRAILSR